MRFGLGVRGGNVSAGWVERARHLVEGNTFLFPARAGYPSGNWHSPVAAAAARRLPYHLVADVPLVVGIDQAERKKGPVRERGLKLFEGICFQSAQETPHWKRVQPDRPHRDGAKLYYSRLGLGRAGLIIGPRGVTRTSSSMGSVTPHPDHLPADLALDELPILKN